jgi:hypothetical protein
MVGQIIHAKDDNRRLAYRNLVLLHGDGNGNANWPALCRSSLGVKGIADESDYKDCERQHNRLKSAQISSSAAQQRILVFSQLRVVGHNNLRRIERHFHDGC